MTPLTSEEKRLFLGWLNTRKLRAVQIAEVGRASGRLELASLLETGVGKSHSGLPPNLTKDRALTQAAKLRAEALQSLGHFARSSRMSVRNLMRLHSKLRGVKLP